MTTVVVAPDSFGGTLSATQAAAAIADGWSRERPQDEVVAVPMSDGGEGLIEALGDRGSLVSVEVAGPLGHPVTAAYLAMGRTAIIESAEACGLKQLGVRALAPLLATTYGVGQLIDHAIADGKSHVIVGLGGSASIDGGAGALSGLGFALTVDDGSGLKIGGGDLHRVTRVSTKWARSFSDVRFEIWHDVDVPLADAARVFGPQKGASVDEIKLLEQGLTTWSAVTERDLCPTRSCAQTPGAGAAGGLGFGLMCALQAQATSGVDGFASLIDLDAVLARADIVITGEGRLDATSSRGKVVGALAQRCRARNTPMHAVVGQHVADVSGIDKVIAASPEGPGGDPAGDVSAAAQELAQACSNPSAR